MAPWLHENHREERDALGVVRVPSRAWFGAQTQRAIENFPISGRPADPALIRAYLRIKRAAAAVNARLGRLEPRLGELIMRAADQVLSSFPENAWPEMFPVDSFQAGAGTSQNMNVNEVLANLANSLEGSPLGAYRPVHPNDHVNRSQSTNDTFPAAMRLALLELSAPLRNELAALGSALASKAGQWQELWKAARTHLQDAVPIRLGEEIGGYATTASRAARWIEQGRDALAELGLGGSAAGTGLNVPEGFAPAIIRELALLTGENLRPAPDRVEAMQSQWGVMFYSSMLRLAALELTRIGNDLRLLASGPSTGLGELVLPAVQPGSSIMPGKVNPSVVEMLNQVLFAVLGRDHATAMASQAGQLELNVMMPVMARELLEATRSMTAALRVLRTRCIEGLQANPDRLRKHFEATPQIATALSPLLGYEETARLVQEAQALGRSVLDLAQERGQVTADQVRELVREIQRRRSA